MTGPCFVDTNILLYARDLQAAQKHEKALSWVRRLWETGDGRLSHQVLAEFYANVRKLDPQSSPADLRNDVRALQRWNAGQSSVRLIERAWSLQDRFSVSWWDALIVAAAQEAGCRYLLSEDFQAGQAFDSVTVVNPFTTRPDDLD